MFKKYRFLFLSLLFFSLCATVDQQLSVSSQLSTVVDRFPSVHIGIAVRDLKDNSVVYTHSDQYLFIPASNTKLITAAMALDILGPEYQFETIMCAEEYCAGQNTVRNIYIKGAGDPTFTHNSLEQMVQALKRTGIEKISGDVYIDASVFDNEPFAAGIVLDDIRHSWSSAVSACIIDRKPASINGITLFEDIHVPENAVSNIARVLDEYFKKNEIPWSGHVEFKKTPEQATPLVAYYSEPLEDMIKRMLKNSDNLYADCLFKKAASVRYGAQGSWCDGIRCVKDFLSTKVGIPLGTYVIEDGSGRSRYNYLSPDHIVQLLSWVSKQPFFEAFYQGLARAGVDGTLKNRMCGLSIPVRAKTGTMAGISALSGYISDDNDNLLAFSILTNGFVQSQSMAGAVPLKIFTPSGPNYKTEIEDAICAVLASGYSALAVDGALQNKNLPAEQSALY